MVRRALAQIWRDLAAIHLDHRTRRVEDGEDDGTVEVLVAALAINAQCLQPSAHLRAGGAVLRRQAIPQRPVGEAQLEPVDHLRRFQTA